MKQIYQKLKEIFSTDNTRKAGSARNIAFSKSTNTRRAANALPVSSRARNSQTQYIENGQTMDIPTFYEEFLKQLYPTSKGINQPKNFSKLEPAKLDELKQAPVQGVDEMIITYPEPKVKQNWMSQAGGILSTLGSLVQTGLSLGGGISSLKGGNMMMGHSGQIQIAHTGKKISGKDEILTILRGGETVRTETQEQELQQEKMKELMCTFAPMVSGEEDENNPYSNLLGKGKKRKESNTPVLINKTSQDEDFIIHTAAQAWRYNRNGFRNVLRYE